VYVQGLPRVARRASNRGASRGGRNRYGVSVGVGVGVTRAELEEALALQRELNARDARTAQLTASALMRELGPVFDLAERVARRAPAHADASELLQRLARLCRS
jgi:hypothetical protein